MYINLNNNFTVYELFSDNTFYLTCERGGMSKCSMCSETIPNLTEKRAIVLNSARQVKRDIYSFI